MAECRKRAEQRPEMEKLYWLIASAVLQSGEKKPRYWTEKLYSEWCGRMQPIRPGLSWTEVIAGMSDEQAYGRFREPKHRRMMLLIRDASREKHVLY